MTDNSPEEVIKLKGKVTELENKVSSLENRLNALHQTLCQHEWKIDTTKDTLVYECPHCLLVLENTNMIPEGQ